MTLPPTLFLLIRHGATDAVGRSIAGWAPGVLLNEAGRRQAERLADRLGGLPIAGVYSSPLERALETAAPLARRAGVEVGVLDPVGEVRFGEWTGRTLEALAEVPEWRRFNTFRSGTRAPGGELMLEVQTRAVRGLEELRARHPGQTVAVVSHGDVLRAVVAYYAGIPLDLFQRLEIGPASVSVLELGDYGPRLLRLNDQGEVPPDGITW